MACVIEGVPGRQWSAPEWMARNAAFFLIPQLAEQPQGAELSARLQTIIEDRAPRVPLGDLLALPAVAAGWDLALNAAEAQIAQEDPLSWNDPESYEPFRVVFAGLRQLPLAPQPTVITK